MKKVSCLVLIVTLFLGGINVSAVTLSDISRHWAAKEIQALIDLGIVNGYPDGTFKPENTVDVGSFLKMTVAALGFKDIPNATNGLHWARNFQYKAIELGLVGKNDYVLAADLNKVISRKEMARIAVRAYEYLNNTQIDITTNHSGVIKDFAYTPQTYERDILKAYKMGIITGYPDGTFKPDADATRATAAVIILRILDAKYRVSIPLTSGDISKMVPLEPEFTDAEKEAIFEHLRTAYPTENGKYGDMKKDNDLFVSLNSHDYEYAVTDRVKTVINALDVINSRDYRYIPDDYRARVKYHINDNRLYRTATYKELNPMHPDVFVDVTMKELKDMEIVQRNYFLTDDSLIYYEEKAGYYIVRGRWFYRADQHNNIDDWDNQLFGIEIEHILLPDGTAHYQYEVGKWYYADIDVAIRYTTNGWMNWEKSQYAIVGLKYRSLVSVLN